MSNSKPEVALKASNVSENELSKLLSVYPLCFPCSSQFFNPFPPELTSCWNALAHFPCCLSCLGVMSSNEEFWKNKIATEVVQYISSQQLDPNMSFFSLSLQMPICDLVRNSLLQQQIGHLVRSELQSLLPHLKPTLSFSLFSKERNYFKSHLKNLIAMGIVDTSKLSYGGSTHVPSFNIQLSLAFMPISKYSLKWLSNPEFIFAFEKCSGGIRKNPCLFLYQQRKLADDILLQLSATQVEQFGPNLSLSSMRENKVHPNCCQSSVKLEIPSLFIAGRYIKKSRTVCQSPWTAHGSFNEASERHKRSPSEDVDETGEESQDLQPTYSNSVSGYIEEILNELVHAKEVRFSSAGREDADVRMLGLGRPFLLEFVYPKRITISAEDFAVLNSKISNLSQGAVEINMTCVVDGKLARKALLQGEENKSKVYRCVIWSQDPINSSHIAKIDAIHSLSIEQDTPIRVCQRRVNMNRPKIIYRMAAQSVPADPHFVIVYLHAQAGTYIKEFVHGDLGRTRPSLGFVIGSSDMDLIELDVLHVDLDDWPPPSSILTPCR